MHVYATGSKTVRVVVLISGSWGGVGWSRDNSNRVYGYATWSSLALHATLLDFHLHFHDLHLHFMLRCLIFTCTFMIFTCTSCYAARFSLALSWSSLALHATLLDFHLHFRDLHLHFMLRYLSFTCTFMIFTCTSCYATWFSLALSLMVCNWVYPILPFGIPVGPHFQTLATTLTTSHIWDCKLRILFRSPALPLTGGLQKLWDHQVVQRPSAEFLLLFIPDLVGAIWHHLPGCLGVGVLAEDLKLRGAIIRDKELIMLPNEQATRWEDGEGGRSEWLRRPAVRNWFSLYN